MEEELIVRVHKVELNGKIINVGTIEHGARREVDCRDCLSVCCKASPVLTHDEFVNRKFQFVYTQAPDWLKEKGSMAEYLVTVPLGSNGYCMYFDMTTHTCSIFSNCPKGCLEYDCRDDPRQVMQDFVKKIFGD